MVGWLVRRWAASRTDLSVTGEEQYERALPTFKRDLGGVRPDRLDREDVARWLATLARDGQLSRRSVDAWRNVLTAALADAIEEGLLRRSPTARVPAPWSELLALRWDDIDLDRRTARVDQALLPTNGGEVWPAWVATGTILGTRTGVAILARSFDRALVLLIDKAGVPRLSNHGLRHTAATHRVRHAEHVGELGAVADLLGHSPDLPLRVYPHALPGDEPSVSGRKSHATTTQSRCDTLSTVAGATTAPAERREGGSSGCQRAGAAAVRSEPDAACAAR